MNHQQRQRNGIRADMLGRRFASALEANVARVLRYCLYERKLFCVPSATPGAPDIAQLALMDWNYEPRTFKLRAASGQAGSYTPDFGLMCAGIERPLYLEVKGPRTLESGRAKLARMAASYPHITVILIGPDEYRLFETRYRPFIKTWEYYSHDS